MNAVKKSQANNPNYKTSHLNAVKKNQEKQPTSFPPLPPSEILQHTIISNFCKDTSPDQFIESGCAVCGKLTSILELTKLSKTNLNLDILIQPGMSQKERTLSDDPIMDIEGPILDNDLNNICKSCFKSLSQGKVLLMALANEKWIGKVPSQLHDLSFAKQLLVARVWHNRCLVKVSSGMHKMRANAKKKACHLNAVKKYQTNNLTYKSLNLAAVKKSQANNPDYKTSNLNAVKKSQANNPDYKTSNLNAVKKSQANNSDYKTSHLNAVKKSQANNSNYKTSHLNAVKKSQEKQSTLFPPLPPSEILQHTIISNFCKDTSPDQFIESGCAICGKLTSILELTKLSETNLNLDILIQPGMSQKERTSSDDPIMDIEGPILDNDLNNICKSCFKSLSQGKVPLMALANGKWIGKVPSQLHDLSFAEQLLVARVRHNRCLVKVSSGMHKMRANAITFANPMPKIYDILPPPIEEMDDVLAFIYTGPCKPTKADFERTPLLVRRKKVSAALEWLKLNHCDYFDLEILYKNLSKYPEDSPPVLVDYQYSTTNKNSKSTAVNDIEAEDGTETGQCPFVVHGLTGEEFCTKSLKAIKAIALKHLTSNGKILAIGYEKQAQSIYKNPQLFPQMMPWLFPYGLGGIGNFVQQGRLSDIAHKRHLLMYHDKQFQKILIFH